MSSNDDILKALNSLTGEVGSISGKLDLIRDSLKDHTDRMNRIDRDIVSARAESSQRDNRLDKKSDASDKRIGHLERRQFAIYAVAIVVSTIIGFLVKIIPWKG
jgi:chromosome segregation ATPase